jgi:hypothetical protein
MTRSAGGLIGLGRFVQIVGVIEQSSRERKHLVVAAPAVVAGKRNVPLVVEARRA